MIKEHNSDPERTYDMAIYRTADHYDHEIRRNPHYMRERLAQPASTKTVSFSFPTSKTWVGSTILGPVS